MGDLLKLVTVAAGGWAGYRAYQANKEGIPLGLAFKFPDKSIAALKVQRAAENAAKVAAQNKLKEISAQVQAGMAAAAS